MVGRVKVNWVGQDGTRIEEEAVVGGGGQQRHGVGGDVDVVRLRVLHHGTDLAQQVLLQHRRRALRVPKETRQPPIDTIESSL